MDHNTSTVSETDEYIYLIQHRVDIREPYLVFQAGE